MPGNSDPFSVLNVWMLVPAPQGMKSLSHCVAVVLLSECCLPPSRSTGTLEQDEALSRDPRLGPGLHPMTATVGAGMELSH